MKFNRLPNDLICYIFLQLKNNPIYYLVNKQIYSILSSEYYWRLRLLMYFPKVNIIKADPKLIYELHYNKSLLSRKHKETLFVYYKIHILYFMINNYKSFTIIPCRNSYHRMLVHQFCHSKQLKHEKIQIGHINGLKCPICNFFTITRNIDYEDDYYLYWCYTCKSSLSKYSVIKDKAPHYGIKVSRLIK